MELLNGSIERLRSSGNLFEQRTARDDANRFRSRVKSFGEYGVAANSTFRGHNVQPAGTNAPAVQHQHRQSYTELLGEALHQRPERLNIRRTL